MKKIFAILLVMTITFLSGSVSTAGATGSHWQYGIEKQDCLQCYSADVNTIHVAELQVLYFAEVVSVSKPVVAELGVMYQAPEQSEIDPPNRITVTQTPFYLRW